MSKVKKTTHVVIDTPSSVASAVNQVIEERKEGGETGENQSREVEGADDVLVSLGDLTEAKIEDITFGKNYEAIAMDYVATFNGAITQGVSPLKALMAMCQACAIVTGQCIRAGLRVQIAYGLLKYMVGAIKKASGEVKIAPEVLNKIFH